MAGRGSDSDSEDEEPTIAEESVVTKYKSAGEIANRKWNRTAVKWTLRDWFYRNKPILISALILATLMSVNLLLDGVTDFFL